MLCFAPFGCSPDKEDTGKLQIVATTGMIGDAVKNMVGDSAEVFVLMGPGVDPHLYKPTPRDVDQLAAADIIVYNGLHLEGKMSEILEKISKQKKVIAVSDGIPGKQRIEIEGSTIEHPIFDPHIWFDVFIWEKGISHLGNELADFDTIHSEYYIKRKEEYVKKLKGLHEWAKSEIKKIPKEQRVLITAHDAFNYFGKAYNIEVMGLQGISTVAEPGLKDITDLVNLITKRKIKAVFVESSVSAKAINAVIAGCRHKKHKVIIGGTLFSDAMGAEGTPEGTYIGMVESNVRVIVKGLK